MTFKLIMIGLTTLLSACGTVHDIAIENVKIPKAFYSESFGQCHIKGYKGSEINSRVYRSEIEPLIGFDWQEHHKKYSTSMVVDHIALSRPMAYLSAASHHAAQNTDDDDELQRTTNFIFQIAKNNQFMNTTTYAEASTTVCYGGNNNTSAPCPIHAPQHLGINMTTYLISAYWLKDHFTKEQLSIINPYIDRIYKKYILPRASNRYDDAFTEMANLGMGNLVYAAWTNDINLAKDEFKLRFRQMDGAWEDSGYIKGNSYRGVRGIFYHSMGVEIGLVYLQLAKAWGATPSTALVEKVKKSAEIINVYIENPENYYNYSDKKIPYNASKNPADSRGIQSQAIALRTLMKNVVGVELKYDSTYERQRTYDFIDVMVGFNPECMFSN